MNSFAVMSNQFTSSFPSNGDTNEVAMFGPKVVGLRSKDFYQFRFAPNSKRAELLNLKRTSEFNEASDIVNNMPLIGYGIVRIDFIDIKF